MIPTTNLSRILAALVALAPLPLLADPSTSWVDNDKSRVDFEGVLMLDGSRFDGVYGKGEMQTETLLRRATFGVKAELSPTVEIELSAKLDDGLDEAKFKDALLSWKMAKRQQLIVGRQKEPVGLENNQSSQQIATIERSMATALFIPDRHTGLLYLIRDKRYSAAIGLFEADDDSDDSGLASSGRVTLAVVKGDIQTVHLGASATSRDMGGTSIKLNDEGGINPAANIISGKRRDVDRMQTMALEAAWLCGPLLMQAEWMQSDWRLAENAPDPDYSGGYIQAAWLFGHPRRSYRNGKFKLSGLRGSSVWEAVLRAEQADLRDTEDGKQAETLMAGVNYYQGKQLRIMAGLLTADTSGPDVSDNPSGNGATVRLQYAF